jgi:hypothetical protein
VTVLGLTFFVFHIWNFVSIFFYPTLDVLMCSPLSFSQLPQQQQRRRQRQQQQHTVACSVFNPTNTISPVGSLSFSPMLLATLGNSAGMGKKWELLCW